MFKHVTPFVLMLLLGVVLLVAAENVTAGEAAPGASEVAVAAVPAPADTDAAVVPEPASADAAAATSMNGVALLDSQDAPVLDAVVVAEETERPEFVAFADRAQRSALVAKPAPTPTPRPAPYKWIDINLTKQTITAYVGTKPVKSVKVSSGVSRHPTVVGTFYVYVKMSSQRMTGGSRKEGDYYDLPSVPNVMYFFDDFAIHGAYWHRNFGHPMSHGCVNLSLGDARWFYEWTPIGTPVVTHA